MFSRSVSVQQVRECSAGQWVFSPQLVLHLKSVHMTTNSFSSGNCSFSQQFFIRNSSVATRFFYPWYTKGGGDFLSFGPSSDKSHAVYVISRFKKRSIPQVISKTLSSKVNTHQNQVNLPTIRFQKHLFNFVLSHT